MQNSKPNRKKKWVPLAVLGGCIVLLCAALMVLSLNDVEGMDGEGNREIPLFDAAVEDVLSFGYAGNNVQATLLQGSDGTWRLDSDPTLPLEQNAVKTLAGQLLALTAERQLTDSERGEIPPQGENPAMRFSVVVGETTHTLEVDALNDVVGVYYVYDEAGNVYTVAQADLSSLTPSVRSLYAAQALTDKAAADVATMQVGTLEFAQNDGVWTLVEDAAYTLDQSAVNKMARTICEMQTEWSITTPEADSVYGLENPNVTVVLGFTDGSSLTTRIGDTLAEDAGLCYLSTDAAHGVVYEVSALNLSAFAVSKQSLAGSTLETAQKDETGDIIAESPVGGADDYADADSAEYSAVY